MWVLRNRRKFIISVWRGLASLTKIIGIGRTWTFPGQAFNLQNVQVFFCTAIYSWKGIWGLCSFVCLMGFLCDHLRESRNSSVFLNFILYLLYYTTHRLLERSEAWFVLGICTWSDISSGAHKEKKANKCSRLNPFLGYNYFFKGVWMEYAF